MYDQLEKYLKDESLLYEFQSGFRPSFSTDTCLIHLSDYIRKEWDKGNYTGMVVLDLQKAFDTVNHTILLGKLRAVGLAESSIKWFDSYVTGRNQVVDIDGVHSEPREVTCGVPQGSILGPLLFLVYVNDMVSAVNCKLLLYADDSALMVSHRDVKFIQERLGLELEAVNDWLIDNKLSLHLGKTESILFVSKRKLAKHSELKSPIYPQEGITKSSRIHTHSTRSGNLALFKPRMGTHGQKTSLFLLQCNRNNAKIFLNWKSKNTFFSELSKTENAMYIFN